ncbi:UDP-N-acetylmuramate dehydrogenase [Kocuria rosea subsp. polaris]|uniref:UDP-N-acetylmuramate dehydrogenase n=1 Tax=Kocuria rosea subsp. polaris TaxID=136273 RepID=A0A0W8I4J2_KOCRO|nr:circularly permuted type 2 ATP-grasp protein [Kocuria polaris]KUG52966.1 UDP-N-acetylmuramate dehydrogenase [Kocuria polaris]
MSDLFENYATDMAVAAAYDEMFTADQRIRSGYDQVGGVLDDLSLSDVNTRADSMARSFLDRGVTFDFAGEERPFPLDIVPRVITAGEWDVIERGVKQRVRALECFLDDVYGEQRVVADGIVPKALITSSAHFHRAVWGFRPPGGVRIHVAGIDVVRDQAGVFRVLEDNVRVPSGVSYVIENRRAMTKGLPEAFMSQPIRAVEAYPRHLYKALRATAPEAAEDPTVVVLTPGVFNSAYFEHTLLAGLMGVELVEGRDLVVRGDKVYMRTTDGEQRVDVIYKRIDDEFVDPLHFRSDSALGCSGLVNAARAGNVTIANAIGNGVADDKLTYSYVPDLIRYYLDEEPVLPNVDTYRLEEDEARAYVLEHLEELVVKPVDGSGGKGLVIGPQATEAELQELRAKVLADPRGWIAQPVLQLSTVPTFAEGGFSPRHVDLRPFAVNSGDEVYVLPGGLTRVAMQKGSLIVNSSQGGGSKDTWVLGQPQTQDLDPGQAPPQDVDSSVHTWPVSASWQDEGDTGQQQQQQQAVAAPGTAGSTAASTTAFATDATRTGEGPTC